VTPIPTRAELCREAHLVLVLAIIGEHRHAVHLPELYATLRRYPHWAHRDDRELRALLDRFGIPVRRQVRVGALGGRAGVHRDDVEPRLTGLPIPHPPPQPPPLYAYIPGQRPVDHRVEHAKPAGEKTAEPRIDHMDPVIVDVPAAALHCTIDPARIRQWLRRGRLTHHGYAHRRALVDLVEIEALLHDTNDRAMQAA